MATRIRCPSCGLTSACAAAPLGKTLRCSGCAKRFRYNAIARYQILEELGRGGFGVVYRVFDPKLEREAAVKVLHADVAQQEGSVQSLRRFRNEAKLLAQIVHPNIVPLYEADEHKGRLYLVTALIRGRPLDAGLSPHGSPDPRRAATLTIALLEALHHVHATYHICHRDVKPANILIGDGDSLFLMDFGLAVCHDQDTSRITTNGTTLGTPAFMPPEQAEGEITKIGPHSDQYSAGIVLYYLLTGKVPFRKPMPAILTEISTVPPPPPSSLCPDLDPALDRIILRALEKDPHARYPDCHTFADALRDWSQGCAPIAYSGRPPGSAAGRQETQNLLHAATIGVTRSSVPAGPAPTTGTRAASKLWAVVAGALLTATLLGAGGYFLLHSSDFLRHAPPTTHRKGQRDIWESE